MKTSNSYSQPTMTVINTLLEEQKQFLQNDSAPSLARILSLFSEDVDFYIPGDENTVNWIGKKKGRTGVAHFYEELKKQARPQMFTVHFSVVEGEKVVLIGALQTVIISTGKKIESEFAFVFKVKNEKIHYFRLYEDSWAVSQAVQKD